LKIEEASFINRQSELAFFKKKALEIVQGRGEDLFFISQPGRGKTALLRELKEILFWEEIELIPVYFSFSGEYVDLWDFTEEYLVSMISQILLFKQKELLVGPNPLPLSFSALKGEAEKQGKDVLEKVILSHQEAYRIKDERKGLLNALEAPGRIAQAINKPIWMILDHIQEIEGITLAGKGVVSLWRKVIASPWAPHLFSGEPPEFLKKVLLPILDSSKMDVMELAPLSAEEGLELAIVLGRFYDLEMANELIKIWFTYLEGNPGTLISLLRETRLEAGKLESHQRFIEIYLNSLYQGELGRGIESRLWRGQEADPLKGGYFLRFLNRLVKSGGSMVPLRDIQKSIDLPGEMVQPLVRLLERAGIIGEHFGNIALENSRILRDWVEVLIRKYLRQEDLEQIIREMSLEMDRHLSGLGEGEQDPSLYKENSLHFSLVLPINSESELVAVRALEQIATYSELDETSIEKVKIALIEACINASEHSQSFEKKIRVYFSVQPGILEIIVEDRGQAFNPVEVQARIIREADPLLRKRGRGLGLIQEMMDDVRFEKAHIGTRLYMVKKKFSEKV